MRRCRAGPETVSSPSRRPGARNIVIPDIVHRDHGSVRSAHHAHRRGEPLVQRRQRNHRQYNACAGLHQTSLAQYSTCPRRDWYAPDHGSPLDYSALLAGNTDGSITKPSSDTTLVDELQSAGYTWGAYMEAMPFSCDTSNWPSGSNSSTALYALDHNPFTYYSSTRTTAACQNNIPVAAPSTIPVQASPTDPFANDMSAGGLPDFMCRRSGQLR